MHRLLTVSTIFYILLAVILFVPIDAAVQRKYSTKFSHTRKRSNVVLFLATGIADIVRKVFRRGLNRIMSPQTSYDSDVFRYTQLSQRGTGGLYAGRYEDLYSKKLK
jgi:hypothetical protein